MNSSTNIPDNSSANKAKRSVLVVTHTGRPAAVRSAKLVIERLAEAGITVRVLADEAEALACAGVDLMPMSAAACEDAEMVIVLGGDGTLLRAAELARPVGTPLLGVNLGHVGFLAEAEREDLAATVDKVVTRRYDVEERMTIDIAVRQNGTVSATTWALNEASVEKASRERMLELVVEIDGRPLSHWGCDGVVCATPTGSTAYAFSAGGPVVWPEVEAMLVVPISAHALFARPLVVSPRSVVALEVLSERRADERPSEGTDERPAGEHAIERPGEHAIERPGERSHDRAGGGATEEADTQRAVLWCDGRRKVSLPPGARVEVRRGTSSVRLARLHQTPFTNRLVTKFGLPVTGWRGRRGPHVTGDR